MNVNKDQRDFSPGNLIASLFPFNREFSDSILNYIVLFQFYHHCRYLLV